MTIFQAIFLGLLEGLTEFIPVSSTAHLLMGEELLGVSADGLTFSFTVIIQMGAVLGLIIFFWKDLALIPVQMLAGIRRGQPVGQGGDRLGWLILLAMLPVIVLGFLLRDLVQEMFGHPMRQAATRLLVTALLLALAETIGRGRRSLDQINWKDAIWIGLAQAMSVFPGASRSGASICGGMLCNFERTAATRFAFLLSVPVLLAASVYEMIGLLSLPDIAAFLPALLAGFISAALSGYFAVRWLMQFIGRHSWYAFAIYCAVLGAVAFIFSIIKG